MKPTAQPAVHTPTPLMTTTHTAPANSAAILSFPRSQRVPVSSSSSSSSLSSRGRRWRQCASWLVRSGAWVSRRRYELLPVSATTAIATLGLAQDGLGAAIAYGTLAVGSGAGAVAGLRHKNPVITHIGAAGFVALADITTAVAVGFSWPTLTAWTLSTGAAYGVYGPWLAQQRNTRMKLNVDTVKAKGALPDALGLEAADPGLIGSTIQETALRRAIHALVGVTPLDVPAFQHTDNGGFVALVRMPAGKNTSPDAIIKKRQQLAANLGLDGELQLTKGSADNEMVVRLITADALAGTIPYSDDGGTSLADPLRLGWDEHGQPVNVRILYRHTLIAGSSDWGKSGLINLIIKRLARRADVDIYGIDMKPGSVELGPWEPLMKRVAKGAEEARDLLDWIRAECDRRGKILADLSAQELAAGREPVRKWIPGVHGNGIVVVTDELAELIRQDEEMRRREAELLKLARKDTGADMDIDDLMPRQPIATQYESLLAIARFLAIQFVSATQQPSRKVFGGNTDARGNYANRISTRTGEAGHAPFIFGQGCQNRGWRPEELDLPGKFLISGPELEYAQPKECRAEYVTDADIAADVGHLHARNLHQAAMPPGVAVFQQPTTQTAPQALTYPDGTAVGRDEWPDLYREFQRLGSATKDELTEVGPFASRDTVRRALAVWEKHGVQSRREGRATRYYLTDNH